MRTPLRTALFVLCLAGAPGVTPGAAAAEPPAASPADAASLAPEVAQLREQVAQLRQTLERLDRRLQQIQNQTPAPAAGGLPAPIGPAAGLTAPAMPATPPADPALDAHQQAVLKDQVRTADALNAWQGLHNGMDQDTVRRLLGEPQSTMTVGNRTGWIYTYRAAGKGSVFFGSDGRVVSLMSPGQGALHLY